jgi:DNA repair protein RAD57
MSAIYLGTEAPLNTKRLEQILESGPTYQELSSDDRPTFQRIHSLTIHDFKAQQAVVENHLSHAVEQYNAGLVVIDSVAANFRAYHNSSTSTGLKQRAAELIRLGAILRRLAKERNIAVIVTNQVSDRFVSNLLRPRDGDRRTSSPATSTAPACQSQPASSVAAKQNPVLTLDHQQCFFTGWGNDSDTRFDLKNPALGLAWANQLSARVVLKLGKDSARTVDAIGKRKRCVSLVFSSWGPPSKESVQYSIEMQGVVSGADQKTIREHEELLDETLWDIADEDEEFP